MTPETPDTGGPSDNSAPRSLRPSCFIAGETVTRGLVDLDFVKVRMTQTREGRGE